MFLPEKDDATSSKNNPDYKPGVYTSQMKLNNASLNLEIVVDADHIKSVRFVNLDDSVTTMYPLVEPSLETISEQLYNDVPVNEVVLSKDSKYTQTLLLDTITSTLKKAVPN